ncbi:hypothetical protein BTN99_05495 [Vibrio campbellii]|nr:hypothetical protein BTN99_05495 [Vibrio campbellii]
MSQLINSVEGRAINSLPNYILQIRFPYFKKLKKDSTINFDFPFTVLVGPNGSGKSSTLQALYGCPAGYNVAHYWFSTAIDPITESGGEAYRYIYKYKPAKFPHEVRYLRLEFAELQILTTGNRIDPEKPMEWHLCLPIKKNTPIFEVKQDGKKWKKMLSTLISGQN